MSDVAGEPQRKAAYTARARVVGGRAKGHGETDDGVLALSLRKPAELGGEGGAANPEQLLAIGWAACFEGALSRIASDRGLETGEVAIEAAISLLKTASGMELGARLDVAIPALADPAAAAELVRAADAVCPYSKATRGNVAVELTANGGPVAESNDTEETDDR